MQLVLDTKGLQLLKNGQTFEVISEKGKRTISPGKLTSIAITATITISTDAIVLAIKNQIPILFFNYFGKAKARLWSPYFENIASLRRAQAKFTESTEGTSWMVDLFMLKTEGQLNNLHLLQGQRIRQVGAVRKAMTDIRKLSRSFEQYRDKFPETCRSSIMGTEGSIARIYWQTVGNTLPRKYSFSKRSRQPAQDHFNAALNYFYGMLYSVVEGGIFATGLDPYMGILHVDDYKKPTLSFDLIEAFRPWIDRLLIEQCLQAKIDAKFFSKNQYGIFLNKHGKSYLIPLFNDFLRSNKKFLNQEASVKNQIYHLSSKLAQRIRST